MRIALILPGFSAHPDDWAIPALQHLAHRLARRHELHVFSLRYPSAGVYRFDGLTHTALGGGQNYGAASARLWLAATRSIVRQHRATPFDVLHAFWADEAGVAAALAARVLDRPLVVSIGGGELAALPDINYGAARFGVRRLTSRVALAVAAAVTAGSAWQVAGCRTFGVAAEKLHLAPLGVDIDQFQPLSQPPLAPPTLVQAASLLPVKNQALLLEVLRRVKASIPDIRLQLAGDGPQEAALRQLARRLDLSANIVWRGQLPYPAMADFYQSGQLYLQSSRHESQGMAVLEAMACGLPGLGTPVGVMESLASARASGKAGPLAAQVVACFNDESGYVRLRRAARETIETHYNLAVTTAAFEQLYRQVQ